jgi:hypothetical protein
MRSVHAPETEAVGRTAGADSLRDSRSIRSPGAAEPEELGVVVRPFKKAIIERALGGELTHLLG